MKVMLTIVMCSTLANTCLEPYTYPKVYNTYYDCLLDGYQKSLDKTKEIGKSETISIRYIQSSVVWKS